MFAASLANIAPWFAGCLLLLAAVGLSGIWLKWDASADAPESPVNRSWRRRAFLLGLLAFFAAVALYGSLVPFERAPLNLSVAFARFGQLWRSNLWFFSRTDTVANVLLFVPLGFLGTAILDGRLSQPLRLAWKVSLVLFLCAIYSCILEFSQFWFPTRTPSQNDIATQVIGTVIGVGLWVAAGRLVTRAVTAFYYSQGDRTPLYVALWAYMAIVAFYSMLPLDLTLSPADLYHKLKDGHVVFSPLPASKLSVENWPNTLGNSLMFCTVGALAAASRGRCAWGAVLWAMLWGFALAALVECAQLFVVGGYTKTFDILNGMLSAGVGGWYASFLLLDRTPNGTVSADAAAVRRRVWPFGLLAVVWGAALVLVYCAPFEILTDQAQIVKRLAGLGRTPFSSLYWSNPLGALETVLQKFLLFAPLGLLAGCGIERLPARQSSGAAFNANTAMKCIALALIALFATAIEYLQVYFPPHVADLTDAGLATFAATFGLLAASRICINPGQ